LGDNFTDDTRIMKKIIIALLLLGTSLQAAERLVSQDPSTNSGKMKVTSIFITSGKIAATNSVASVAVEGTNTGPAVAGTVIKAGDDGLISPSLVSSLNVTTNAFLTTEIASTADTLTNLVTITLNQTNGVVFVNAQSHVKSKDSTTCGAQGLRLLRISGNTPPYTTNIASEVSSQGPSEGGKVVNTTWAGVITSTNTFVLQGVTDTTSAQLVWGGTAKDYYFPPSGAGTGGTNSTSLMIINLK
jgi:hypothetical protein